MTPELCPINIKMPDAKPSGIFKIILITFRRRIMKKILKNITLPIYGPFYWLFKIANNAKEKGRLIEFYAFPVLLSTLATFAITRLFTRVIFRDNFFSVNDVHIHHFVIGIAIQQIVVFALFVNASNFIGRRVYKLALLYGVGLGLILDELDVILKLDASAKAHGYTYGVIAGCVILIILITSRAIFDVIKNAFSKKI